MRLESPSPTSPAPVCVDDFVERYTQTSTQTWGTRWGAVR
jgi:hypothetical protein